MRELMAIGRWKSLEMAQRYMHTSVQAARGALRLSDIDRRKVEGPGTVWSPGPSWE